MVIIDAYVPASMGEVGTNKHYPKLLEKAKVQNKALIPLDNRPMVSYVVEALDQAKYIRSITVLGLTQEDIGITTKTPIYFIPGGDSSYETLNLAIDHFNSLENPPDYVMNVSSDIPLVSGEMIDRVVESIDFSEGLELYFNMITERLCREMFPDAHKVAIKLKEGNIFLGDIHIFQRTVLDGRREQLQQIMGVRKSVFSVIKTISLRYIFKYIFGRLTVDDVRERFKQLYDLDAAFLLTEFPETCLDLDYEDDIERFNIWIRQDTREISNEKVYCIRSSHDFKQYLELNPH